MNPPVPLLINQLAERKVKGLRQFEKYFVLRCVPARYVRRLSFYVLRSLHAADCRVQSHGAETAINAYRFAVGVP